MLGYPAWVISCTRNAHGPGPGVRRTYRMRADCQIGRCRRVKRVLDRPARGFMCPVCPQGRKPCNQHPPDLQVCQVLLRGGEDLGDRGGFDSKVPIQNPDSAETSPSSWLWRLTPGATSYNSNALMASRSAFMKPERLGDCHGVAT